MSPETSLEAQPWWEALTDGRLMAQRCESCGVIRHYPSPMCGVCQSSDVVWSSLSGRGSVHSWTITYQTAIPAFKERVPYALVTVDLAEGVRLLAPLMGMSFEALRTGLSVRFVAVKQADGTIAASFIADESGEQSEAARGCGRV
jgi:uncharacterized OB-fold protein